MSSKPSRVSLIPPPPPDKGVFKIEKLENSVMVATPKKEGRFMTSPSHVYDPTAKEWMSLEEEGIHIQEDMSKLSSVPSQIGKFTRDKELPAGIYSTASKIRSADKTKAPPPPPPKMTSAPAKTSTKTEIKSPPLPTITAPTATEHEKATPPSSPNSDTHMNTLIKLLINNNLIKDNSKDNKNEDYDTPRYDTKRGRELYDKASEGLPTNECYELKYSNALSYLKLLRRKSDDFSWGTVLDKIETENGYKSLLLNFREIELEDVVKDTRKCWGHTTVTPTTDPALKQERMIRQMIGNLVRNSLKAARYDQLELQREVYSYYKREDSRTIFDGPTMMKLTLDIMNPDARVNVRDLKDKLRSTKITDFKGDVRAMLTHMEFIYSHIVSENKTYDEYLGDILDALQSVQDKSFYTTVENLQDDYDGGKRMTAQEIIARATKKYDKLLSRNQYYYNDNKKYLNFTADSKGKSSNPHSDHLKAIEEWRKHKIPGKEVIEKDGRTYYFCLHHKNREFGYPEGLYVCSHRPD